MFRDLYEQERLTDLTLVCEDQTQLKAHKIVLSACSSVFKKIIDNNHSQHPLIYLRGIQSYEMESILQFMYLGEGRFYKQRMEEFLKVAKDLEVKHISGLVEIHNEEQDITDETLMDESEKETDEDYEQRQTSENHMQSLESPEVFKTKSTNMTHYRSAHKDQDATEYPCNQCDYQATRQVNLQQHIRSKHEGIKYPCNQCDYQATRQSSLQKHIQSVHEGMKYPCNQCDYQATTQGNLHRHIQRHHQLY